jgi:ankyrin repeat protein
MFFESLLINAIQSDKEHSVDFFINNMGFSVQTRYRYTIPLGVLAAEYGARNALQILINYGIDLNQVDSLGNHALMTAVLYQKKDVVALLLKHQNLFDINAQNEEDKTALMLAFDAGNIRLISMLLEEGCVLAPDKRLPSDLISYAIKIGSVGIVQWLLDNDYATAGTKDRKGNTPLILAARYGSLEIIRLFLEAQSVLTYQNILGQNFLMAAVYHQMPESSILELINHIPEVAALSNQHDIEGNHLLLYALLRSYQNLALDIVRKGASINHRNHRQQTPLIIAVKQNLKVACEGLLAVSSNHSYVNHRDCDKKSAIEWAIFLNNMPILELLLSYGLPCRLPFVFIRNYFATHSLEQAIQRHQFCRVWRLIQQGAAVSLQALESAITHAQPGILALLLRTNPGLIGHSRADIAERLLLIALNNVDLLSVKLLTHFFRSDLMQSPLLQRLKDAAEQQQLRDIKKHLTDFELDYQIDAPCLTLLYSRATRYITQTAATSHKAAITPLL